MPRWLLEDEIVGMDLEWFSADLEGRLGYFVLCMVSRVPVSVASDAEALETVTDYFEGLPSRSEAVPVIPMEKDYKADWLGAAEKGFYAFDGTSGLYPIYRLIAKPSSPLLLGDLDSAIAEIVSRTVAPLAFRETLEIHDDRVWGALSSGIPIVDGKIE